MDKTTVRLILLDFDLIAFKRSCSNYDTTFSIIPESVPSGYVQVELHGIDPKILFYLGISYQRNLLNTVIDELKHENTSKIQY